MTPDDVLGSSHDDDDPAASAGMPRPWRVLIVLALALAAAALLGPDLLSSPGADDAGQPGDRRQSSPPPRAPQPEPPGPLAADPPVRGDLAGDRAFVDAALRRVRAGHPDADRVLFAATLPDGGRVAFVGRDRDEPEGIRALDVYALKVPAGAPVEAGEITVVGRGLIESTSLLGWAAVVGLGPDTDPVVFAGSGDSRVEAVIWSGALRAGERGALLRIRRPDGPAFQLLVGRTVTGESFAGSPRAGSLSRRVRP